MPVLCKFTEKQNECADLMGLQFGLSMGVLIPLTQLTLAGRSSKLG